MSSSWCTFVDHRHENDDHGRETRITLSKRMFTLALVHVQDPNTVEVAGLIKD